MTPRLPLPRSLPGRAPLRVSARFVSSHAGTESRPSPARAALSLPLPGIALSEERCRAALMGAVTADDFALLRLTLAKMTGCGTNPDFRSMRGFSETPLALAVRLGRSLMIPALLRAGADIRQRRGKTASPCSPPPCAPERKTRRSNSSPAALPLTARTGMASLPCTGPRPGRVSPSPKRSSGQAPPRTPGKNTGSRPCISQRTGTGRTCAGSS